MSKAIQAFGLSLLVSGLATAIPAGMVTRKVVDSHDSLPGAADVTGGFSNPALSGDDVAFLVYERFYKRFALFAELDGTLQRIATAGETEFGGWQVLAPFSSLPRPLIHEGCVYWKVALVKGAASTEGVIKYSAGQLSICLSRADVDAAAGEPLTWQGEPRMTGSGRLVLQGRDSDNGTWLVADGGEGLSVLNDSGPLSPPNARAVKKWAVFEEGFAFHLPNGNPVFLRQHLGQAQPFDSGFGALFPAGKVVVVDSIHGNGRWMAVQAYWTDGLTAGSGIYGWTAGRWFVVARGGDTLDDGSIIGGFSDGRAERHSMDGNSLLMQTYIGGKEAVVLFRAGKLVPLVRVGDAFDGGVVAEVLIHRDALEGDRFVFWVNFEGGRQGIYVGDFSAVAPSEKGMLEMQFQPGAGKSGRLDVSGRTGCFYHLLRSEDLKRSVVVESQAGDDAPLSFEFDDSLERMGRQFYWIEEVRHQETAEDGDL